MIDYSKYGFIKVEKRERVAIITLNRSDNLNTIGADEHRQLEDLFADLNQDSEIDAIILTGAGRSFSAGGDLKYLVASYHDPSLPQFTMEGGSRLIRNLLALKRPIVAAINGDALGLGASLALCCDIIICADNTRIADPHIKVGLVPGDGGLVVWPLLTSFCKAKEYLMTGDMVTAVEAERIGLVNKVVPKESLQEEAWKMARRFADGPTQALAWTKRCINRIILERMNLLMDIGLAFEHHTMSVPDHLEAVESILEKRPPHFKGGPL